MFPTLHGIYDAIEDQNEIGWDNYMLGRWSKKWQSIQKLHFDSISSKQSPKRWTSASIQQFMLTCWDIWDFCNTLIHGKGGRLAWMQNWSLDTRIWQEFAMGTKDILLIDHYLFKTHSVCKNLDNTLLRKEQLLWYIGSLLQKAAANAPTNLTNNDNLSDTSHPRWLSHL